MNRDAHRARHPVDPWQVLGQGSRKAHAPSGEIEHEDGGMGTAGAFT
jgi:hypothetical protein